MPYGAAASPSRGTVLNAIAIFWIVFACVFAGALLGLFFRTKLSEHHLNSDTKDVVKVAIAMVATMSALVVSLLISSAKSSYDTRSNELLQGAADIVAVDRVLAHYGPETREARALLRANLSAALERMSPADGTPRPLEIDPNQSPFESLYDKIGELAPYTDSQRNLQAEALKMTMDLGRLGYVFYEQQRPSIPWPFLAVLVFWLTFIFFSFGLYAPANSIVIGVLLVCSLSFAGALFLIVELDQSFEGLIQISSAPLRQALSHLGQ
jgi:hypothetical protein